MEHSGGAGPNRSSDTNASPHSAVPTDTHQRVSFAASDFDPDTDCNPNGTVCIAFGNHSWELMSCEEAAQLDFGTVVPPQDCAPGSIISTELIAFRSRLGLPLLKAMFEGADPPIEVNPTYPLTIYKIVYRTEAPVGNRVVKASGTLFMPAVLAFPPIPLDEPMPVASYQHGTIVRRDDAPSQKFEALGIVIDIEASEGMIGVALATAGYLTVIPDYVGVGRFARAPSLCASPQRRGQRCGICFGPQSTSRSRRVRN